MASRLPVPLIVGGVVAVSVFLIAKRRQNIVDRLSDRLLELSGTRDRLDQWGRDIYAHQKRVGEILAINGPRQGGDPIIPPPPGYPCSFVDRYIWRFPACAPRGYKPPELPPVVVLSRPDGEQLPPPPGEQLPPPPPVATTASRTANLVGRLFGALARR